MQRGDPASATAGQDRGKLCTDKCQSLGSCAGVRRWWWFSHQIVSNPFATPWTVARQAPLFMGFPRQEYWSGLPFPPPGDLPDPGIIPLSPALHADSLPSKPPGKPNPIVSITIYLLMSLRFLPLVQNSSGLQTYILLLLLPCVSHRFLSRPVFITSPRAGASYLRHCAAIQTLSADS